MKIHRRNVEALLRPNEELISAFTKCFESGGTHVIAVYVSLLLCADKKGQVKLDKGREEKQLLEFIDNNCELIERIINNFTKTMHFNKHKN